MVMYQTYLNIIGSLFVFFNLIIVLFSLTTLIIIIRYWHRKCRSIVNLFTCNSCIALLFYVFTISFQTPLFIEIINFHLTDINPYFCKISAGLATFGTLVLSNSYLIQAISRFFITILHKHRTLHTFHTNWLMIIISWITSGITACVLFLSPLAYQYETESHFCTLSTKNFLTSLIPSTINGILTLNIIMFLYGIILYHTAQHTRINPNSSSTLHARRNKKVFQRTYISVIIFAFGGIPYFICILIDRTSQAPWPLYSLAFLCIAFAAALNSIVLLITNDQVKTILLNKLTVQQRNITNPRLIKRTNQIVPYSIQTRL